MRRILIILLLVCPLWPLTADTVLLRNGKKIEGKIIRQSKFQVTLRTANGTKSVSKSSIRRIVFGAFKAPAAEKKDAAAEKRRAEARRKRREEARKKREAARKKKAAAEKKPEKKARKEPARRVEKKPARRPSRPRRVEGNPLLRSLLVPGRGQRSQGRDPAAYAYGGAFFSFFALGAALEWENLRLLGEANARQEELNLMIAVRGLSGDSLDLWQTLRLDTARERANNGIRLSNSVWAITGLIYAANLIDVQLAGGSSLGMAVGPDSGHLVFRMRF